MRGEFWRGVPDSVSRAAFACILCRARDGCDSRSARAFFRWAVSVSRPDARLSAASLISMALIGAVGPAGTKKGAGIATKVPADACCTHPPALAACVRSTNVSRSLEYPPRERIAPRRTWGQVAQGKFEQKTPVKVKVQVQVQVPVSHHLRRLSPPLLASRAHSIGSR